MTILTISHMDTHTDELSRVVTTLTQEVFVKVNQSEEDLFKSTLIEVDENEGCIEYHNDGYSEIDVSGYGVSKAIDTVNSIANHTLIAPVTSISNNEIYRVEFEY